MSDAGTHRATPVRIAGAVGLVAAGWFVGGPIGLVVGAGAVGVASWRGPRFVAGLAVVALVVTAFLTVVEAPTGPDTRGVGFVTERPIASEMGRVAGVLALVSIGFALGRERERSTAEPGTISEAPAPLQPEPEP